MTGGAQVTPLSPPTWSLVQFRPADGGVVQMGVARGDDVLALPAGWPTHALALLDEWRDRESALQSLDVDALTPVVGARLAAPITFPRKVIAAGANYADHMAEMGASADDTQEPFFFLKPPTTAIVGPGDEVPLPAGDSRLDWEAELGVVIADRCKQVPAASAMDHVAGYLVANDLSARGLFRKGDAIAPPFGWDWFSHKAGDGLCPIGPGIVPAWMIADPENLRIRSSVNDVVKQDSTTAQLIVSIAELISAASRLVTLEPGDVILTGTPAGAGAPQGEFLRDGDRVVVEVESVGRLENRIRATA